MKMVEYCNEEADLDPEHDSQVMAKDDQRDSGLSFNNDAWLTSMSHSLTMNPAKLKSAAKGISILRSETCEAKLGESDFGGDVEIFTFPTSNLKDELHNTVDELLEEGHIDDKTAAKLKRRSNAEEYFKKSGTGAVVFTKQDESEGCGRKTHSNTVFLDKSNNYVLAQTIPADATDITVMLSANCGCDLDLTLWDDTVCLAGHGCPSRSSVQGDVTVIYTDPNDCAGKALHSTLRGYVLAWKSDEQTKKNEVFLHGGPRKNVHFSGVP